jgi:hypothetical protein
MKGMDLKVFSVHCNGVTDTLLSVILVWIGCIYGTGATESKRWEEKGKERDGMG